MHIEELFEQFDKQTYYRSFDGRIRKMWETASRRTRDKGHKGQMISQEEFFELASDDPTYKKMYDEWVNSEFATGMTPTLDRKDATKGYLKGNLQFLTYSDNVVKGNQEYDKRPYEARQIIVKAVKDKKTRTFKSLSEVSRFLNVHKSTITRAIQQGNPVDGWALTTD